MKSIYSYRKISNILATIVVGMLFVGLSNFTFTQNIVQIGTGTESPSNTLYSPVYRYSASSTTSDVRSNIKFTAAELTTAGIVAGDLITAISFNKTSTGHFLVPADYTVRMGNNTNSDPLTGTINDHWADILANQTVVYQSTTFDVPDAVGWMVLQLDQPFIYTGGAIEISTELAMTGGSSGADNEFNWEYTSGFDNYVIGTTGSSSGNVSSYKKRPNIQFHYIEGVPCTGATAAGTIDIAQPFSTCASLPLNLTLQGNTLTTGLTNKWQMREPNGTNVWVDIVGADGFSLDLPSGITVETDFRYIVICDASAESDTTPVVNLQVLPPEDCYCTPTVALAGDKIASFSTTNAVTNVNLTTIPDGAYQDLSAGDPITVNVAGESFDFEATYQLGNASYGVWVDWDKNGQFEPSELVFSATDIDTVQGTIPTLLTAAPDTYRMRVRAALGTSPVDPCAQENYGSAIDLSLIIQQAAPPCSGSPTIGTINDIQICAGVPFTLMGTGLDVGITGITYQWQVFDPITSTWSDIAGADASEYTVSDGVTEATSYQLVATCTNTTDQTISNIVNVTLSPLTDCYCIPSATNTSRYIDDFTTTGGIQNITNDASGFSTDGYGDFTSMVVSHYQGEEVNFIASFGGTTTFGFKIWIDWNQDGVFDASEVVFQTSSYSNIHVGSFTVPLTALPGQTRMRIGNSFTPNSGPADPCEIEYSSGEFEDYTFEVFELIACAGIPDAGTLTDMVVCADFDFTLASSGVTSFQTGLTYLWESSPDQVTWTEVYNGTDADYTVIGGVSDTTFFRLTVTCTNSSEVVTSNIMEVTLKPENECYCIPSATNMSRYIDDFTTTDGIQNITNDASGFSPDGYGDFTSMVASHYQGEEVNFTASFGGTTTFGFKIWIDWSQDGVFDASEVVFQTSSYSNTHVGSFTVPLTALPGQTRMRIGNSNTPNSGPADPCEIEYSSGEFEDYTFEIIALPACAGIPDAGTLTDMEVCADFDFTLASSGVSDLQSGLTYLWESSPDQVTWTEVYNGTDADYTVIGGVSDTTFFRLTVTCTNSSEVVTSNIMEVTLKPENVCYCIPEATNVSRYIDDFSATGGTQNITNNTSGFSPGGYGDFTSLIAAQFRGGTVNFDVNYGGTSTYGFKIWIDWEQDGVFDASDVVYETSSYSSSHSGSFTVPPTALTGTTRMRIGNSYTPNSGPTNPCVTGYSSGEFEDYTFIIEAIDAPVITQNPTVPDCITGTELTLSGDISGGYVWYWQVDADSISLDNSTNPLVVYENGTYYAKTYDPATGGWSDASSITVSNIPVAPAPSVPVAAQNPACLPGTTISMDNMDPTLDYYWQGTDDMASDMTDPATVPYDVTTTGTYYVKAHDPVSSCWSEPVGLLVEIGTLIPPTPTVTDSLLYVCTNSTSVMLDAQTVVNTNGSLTTTLAGGNGCGGGAMFDLVVTTNVNITGFDVVPNSNGAQDVNVYYKTGSYQGSQTTPSDWTLAGTYPITGANGVPSFIDITDIPLVAGQNYGFFINYNADYTNEPIGTTYTDGLMTLTVGEGICTTWSSGNAGRAFNGTIYYGENIPAEAAWYDAMTGGNFISNDNPLEAVGTSVMPTATDGTYEFYVASSLEGCESPERVLVTVNVAPVNVTLTAQDVSCNNGNDGTFFIDGTPDCGVPPFTYSVDGGAFGPIPTDLVPGEHTVIVKDDTGAESAEYTIEVGDAPAPDGIIINSISDDMVNVSWNAGSAETAWYVEWGDNTYVPGSGTPIGSITVTDTTHIITGLSPSSSYNIYVYASCGGATSVGEWTTLEVTTTCAPVPALGYCEDFEVISDLGCWIVEDGNEDGELFAIYTDQGYNSAQSGGLDVRTSPTTNDDYIVLPQLTLTGNEVMTFYQKTYASGTVNYEILLSHDELKFTDLDTVYTNVVSGTTWTKVTVDLSAFTGDVFIMLHVGPGSTSGSYVFFDDICIDVCIPVAGVDGVTDVCSEDGSLDLFTTIQSDYNHGSWIFNGNQNLVNGSELSLTYLTDGTYELMYIVDTECTSDTTFSTINVSLPSSAGIGGSITVCKNQPINLFAALSGNVDFGGDWYDYNNQLTPTSHPTSPQFPGSYNYYYVVSNGVCDADTAVVAVNVSSACDWSSVSEEMFGEVMVYPNPASEIIYISSSTNTSDFKLELLDINGRVVYKNDDVVKQNTQTSIDINNLARGVYTLRVFNDDGQRNFKVVKR